MPGTAVGWNSLKTINAVAQAWVNLSNPSAGAALTLHSDGTPESVANPNALHLGYTEGGWEILVRPTFFTANVDEEEDPIIDQIETNETAISATIHQVKDLELLNAVVPGSTYAASSGLELLTGGGLTGITYTSMALIWTDPENVGKFLSFQLYKAINDAGLAMSLGRRTLSGSPVAFKGRSLSSRAAGDRVYGYARRIPTV